MSKDFNSKKIDRVLFGIGVDHSNRFHVFLNNKRNFSDKEYWYALGLAYTATDNLFAYRNQVKKAFEANRRHREYLMTAYEKRRLKSLPNRVRVYRAMTVIELKAGQFGISWTLSKRRADFFAYHYNRNYDTIHLPKVIFEMKIAKTSIVAYFSSRKERELIIFPPKKVKGRIHQRQKSLSI